MFVSNEINCCGVLEMAEIGSEDGPQEVLKALERSYTVQWGNNKGTLMESLKCAYFFFTEADHEACEDGDECNCEAPDYGKDLANLIKENSLGTLYEMPWRKNPNSGNNIKMWVWAADYSALKTYWGKK